VEVQTGKLDTAGRGSRGKGTLAEDGSRRPRAFADTPELLTFIARGRALRELGRRVDLVMRRSLELRLRERSLAEAVPVRRSSSTWVVSPFFLYCW